MTPRPDHTKLFLSAVSNEFESYRRLLAQDLKRPTLDVGVQEDFMVSGGLTLEKLDDYIKACDGIVHLIGKVTGALPEAVAVEKFLRRYPGFAKKVPQLAERLKHADPGFSYTQWEAYLAIFHDRPLFIYRPTDFELAERHCPREDRFVHDAAQEGAQKEHYQRICAMGHDRGQFLNAERLSSAVLRDLVEILPRLRERIVVPPTKLRHVTQTLIGRERELTLLDDAWISPHVNVVVVRGKGGEGKTSLVASWMAELAMKDWRGAEFVYDHSFYSQGTRDQTAASADEFIQTALKDFGDPEPLVGGLEERGARLARLVAARRGLLVLDGLEPLQQPPGPLHGQLKDPGMAALLRGLAAKNAGLCVVTTREKVDEIKQYYGKTAVDHDLQFLSPLAGAALLHNSGATRAGNKAITPDDAELQAASREVHGHALTLFLIGNYLKLAEHGDIRHRDRMKLADADKEYADDAERPYGHAFKAIEAYETWFAAGDVQAKRQLAILRLLGLFDRPAPADCLTVLRGEPIKGLNDSLVEISDKDWNIALGRLTEINLVAENELGAVDCHPLFRECFATRLKKEAPAAFREAHSRLFDHLCETTEHRPDTLERLQPLYQAVVHGCFAGRQQEACDKVYFDRILRGTESDGYFSAGKLGAIGADLGALAAFFDEAWSRISPTLSDIDQAWLLKEAASALRAVGRMSEALQPMRISVKMSIAQGERAGATSCLVHLSQLELLFGQLTDALAAARHSLCGAEETGDPFLQIIGCVAAADALHQAGDRAEARKLFVEAERVQGVTEPESDLLYSLQGFQYCDFLLAPAECTAWRALLNGPIPPTVQAPNDDAGSVSACDSVELRGKRLLKRRTANDLLLDIALDHLTLARVELLRAILTRPPPQPKLELPLVATATNGLRDAVALDYIPNGLLTAALYQFVRGEHDIARDYLHEAQQIAERGPMPLYLADVHLHRARMFHEREELAKAAKLIREVGYGRRYDELADAEEAAKTWPAT